MVVILFIKIILAGIITITSTSNRDSRTEERLTHIDTRQVSSTTQGTKQIVLQ